MTYYMVNTTVETLTILEMFPTQKGAQEYIQTMQPWFTHLLQVVRATEQQHERGWAE